MDDSISRQEAIDTLDELCDRECEYSKKQRSVMCGACHLGSAFDVIEQLPTAQPKTAEWLPCNERAVICSSCGAGAPHMYPYCNYCGAWMRNHDRKYDV